MAKRVFISKKESEVKALAQLLSTKNTELIAHSFLSFEQVEFTLDNNFDILFFSSPRSVVFYKTRYDIPKNKLIACTGSKTKLLLESLGLNVEFSGKESGKISSVAKRFKEWAGDKAVLFPISDISKKTISSLFSEKQKTEVVVYKTVLTPCKIDVCEVYVFSSPSNVRGFLLENEVPKGAKIISWGESTSEELRKNEINIDEEMLGSSLSEIATRL